MTTLTDISRAAADRDSYEAGERRERLRAAKDAVLRHAAAFAVNPEMAHNRDELVYAELTYLKLLISDGNPMTADEQLAARLLGLVE